MVESISQISEGKRFVLEIARIKGRSWVSNLGRSELDKEVSRFHSITVKRSRAQSVECTCARTSAKQPQRRAYGASRGCGQETREPRRGERCRARPGRRSGLTQ